MNTIEIYNYLKGYNQFIGVFPRDQIPENIPINSGLIINTDKAKDPGEHWVSIYLDNDVAVYFDSFGLIPMHREIIIFLNKISPNGWYHNTIPFQSINADTCGMYCVYFLVNYFKTRNFNNFIKIFSHANNDSLAKLIYKIQLE
jgi:hypothetical protein